MPGPPRTIDLNVDNNSEPADTTFAVDVAVSTKHGVLLELQNTLSVVCYESVNT